LVDDFVGEWISNSSVSGTNVAVVSSALTCWRTGIVDQAAKNKHQKIENFRRSGKFGADDQKETLARMIAHTRG
jgi:hypothetical protein